MNQFLNSILLYSEVQWLRARLGAIRRLVPYAPQHSMGAMSTEQHGEWYCKADVDKIVKGALADTGKQNGYTRDIIHKRKGKAAQPRSKPYSG